MFAFYVCDFYDAAAWHRLPGQELETPVTDHGCPRPGLYPPVVVR